MISSINKNVENNTLTVEVTCKIRNFASHPIKILTTNDIIDILKNDYKINKTLQEPKHKVGNTKRQKIQQIGKWVFELEKEQQQEKRKRTTRTKKTSIRSRMSKLAQAQQKKEEEIG